MGGIVVEGANDIPADAELEYAEMFFEIAIVTGEQYRDGDERVRV